MKKINFFSIVLALFAIISFNSCKTTEDSFITNNESGIENSEETVQKYVLLYKDMFNTFIQESREIVESQGDLNAFCSNFKESYTSRPISEEAKMLINKRQTNLTRSSDVSSITVPDNWMEEFKAVLLDENMDCLREKIDQFYNDSYFLNLNSAEQIELKIQLETLETFRNEIIHMLIESYDYENTMTRMSPGDRMIWSECASNIPEDYREYAFNLCMATWSFFPGIGPVFGVVGVASAVYAFFR